MNNDPQHLNPTLLTLLGLSLSLWKIFNVNMPYKHVRLNDPMSKPPAFNDERFIFLTRIVYCLDAWQSLPEQGGK